MTSVYTFQNLRVDIALNLAGCTLTGAIGRYALIQMLHEREKVNTERDEAHRDGTSEDTGFGRSDID